MAHEILQKFAKQIVNAQSRDEIRDVVEELGAKDRVDWKPIGGKNNNLSIAEQASGNSISALSEIQTNSTDAVLKRLYHETTGKETYKSTLNLETYEQAADYLFSESGQQKEDDWIEMVADGERGPPQTDPNKSINFTVADRGEGQPPHLFEERFLDIADPGEHKQDWPFLQGRYGMGGHGSLVHCGKGETAHKFIASAGMDHPGEWSWTLTRLNGSTYEYLVIHEDKEEAHVPRFEGEFFSREIGTVVKLFDYQVSNKSVIRGGLLFELMTTIVDLPIPIKLRDRNYDNFGGLWYEGGRGRLESRDDIFDVIYTIKDAELGKHVGTRDIDVYVFKHDDELEDISAKRQRRGNFRQRQGSGGRAVIFTVNGQRHGDLSQSFLQNRCDKPSVGKDVLIYIDFSDVGSDVLPRLFTPSRSRLKIDEGRDPIGKELRDQLADVLKSDDRLCELEEQRRIRQYGEEQRETELEFLKNIVSQNPNLADLFPGADLGSSSINTNGGGSEPYVLKQNVIPEVFKPIARIEDGEPIYRSPDDDGRHPFEVPEESHRWIRFHLNAFDDYFEDHELQFFPRDLVRSWELANGILRVRTEVPDIASIGSQYSLTLEVVRPGGRTPLKQDLSLTVAESPDVGEGDEPGGGEGNRIGLPEIRTRTQGPPIEITGDKNEEVTCYINVEAEPLIEFLARRPRTESDKHIVRERWKVGLTLYAMSVWNQFDNDDIKPEIIDQTSRSLAEHSTNAIAKVFSDMTFYDTDI